MAELRWRFWLHGRILEIVLSGDSVCLNRWGESAAWFRYISTRPMIWQCSLIFLYREWFTGCAVDIRIELNWISRSRIVIPWSASLIFAILRQLLFPQQSLTLLHIEGDAEIMGLMQMYLNCSTYCPYLLMDRLAIIETNGISLDDHFKNSVVKSEFAHAVER
jgi:hypothetical protein